MLVINFTLILHSWAKLLVVEQNHFGRESRKHSNLIGCWQPMAERLRSLLTLYTSAPPTVPPITLLSYLSSMRLLWRAGVVVSEFVVEYSVGAVGLITQTSTSPSCTMQSPTYQTDSCIASCRQRRATMLNLSTAQKLQPMANLHICSAPAWEKITSRWR